MKRIQLFGGALFVPIAAAAAAFAIFGCIATAADNNARLNTDLGRRASFDLECPEDEVTLIELSESEEMVNSYGVSGCGKRATYILTSSSNGTWVNNSGGSGATGIVGTEAEVTPTPTPAPQPSRPDQAPSH